MIPDLAHMEVEWEAWQLWHKEFTRLTGIDINEDRCEEFVRLTKLWGEELAGLRIHHLTTPKED